jgi:hypothetical protein
VIYMYIWTQVLDVSIWETMVLEERKLEAERRGIRVCDLEEVYIYIYVYIYINISGY